MYKLKQILSGAVKKQIGFAGFLFAIMFFLPTFALASSVVLTNDSSSHSIGTEYQNTDTNPLFVAVNFDCVDTPRVLLSSTTPVLDVNSSTRLMYEFGPTEATFTFIVPSNYYYKLKCDSGNSYQYWHEWSWVDATSSSATTTVATSTTSVVDNPTLDIFMGIVVFMSTLVIILWIYRR